LCGGGAAVATENIIIINLNIKY
jgi:hypothetical protein